MHHVVGCKGLTPGQLCDVGSLVRGNLHPGKLPDLCCCGILSGYSGVVLCKSGIECGCEEVVVAA